MNNQILDVIILFVKAMKNKKIVCDVDGKQYSLTGVKYLLNQILRQYQIDESHFFISKKAQDLWIQLTSKDIKNFYHKETVKCENETPINAKFYKNNGNSFEERELNKGDKFQYRSVFHNDHIIPIEVIIKELAQLQDPNYENVLQVLNKIYVCRMLKEEDRAISAKSKRPNDLNEVLEKMYKPAGIELVDLKMD